MTEPSSPTGRHARRSALWVAVCAAALSLAACGGGSGSASNGAGGGATSVAKFCTDATAMQTTLQSRVNGNLAPLGKSELTSLAAQIHQLASEAPAQIKADVTTMGDFFAKASVNGIDAVDSATTNAESAAEGRVSAWGTQNCGSGSG